LIVIALDFKKAFDSIDRRRLIEIMIEYKINSYIIDLVAKIYSNETTTSTSTSTYKHQPHREIICLWWRFLQPQQLIKVNKHIWGCMLICLYQLSGQINEQIAVTVSLKMHIYAL